MASFDSRRINKVPVALANNPIPGHLATSDFETKYSLWPEFKAKISSHDE